MPGDDWDSTKGFYRKAPELLKVKSGWKVENLAAGNYILAIGIADPAGMQPSLRFANSSYYNGGYTVLGMIGVGKEPEEFSVPKESFQDIQADTSLFYKSVKK